MGAIWKTGNFAWAQNWNEVEDGCKNSDKKRTTLENLLLDIFNHFKPTIEIEPQDDTKLKKELVKLLVEASRIIVWVWYVLRRLN